MERLWRALFTLAIKAVLVARYLGAVLSGVVKGARGASKMATNAEYQRYRGQTRATATPAVAGQLAPTPPDILGPYYRPGAPFCDSLTSDSNLTVHGRVTDVDGNRVESVILDVWQANAAGEYDNETYRFRCRVPAPGGEYHLHTIRPGDYKIADDPPDYRCAHIHVKVTAPGYKPLTTQLYFKGAAHNDTDHWFDERRTIGDDGRFDFVLEKAL
jgi:protocatechuate 3,4-dioxygenase beta subunit